MTDLKQYRGEKAVLLYEKGKIKLLCHRSSPRGKKSCMLKGYFDVPTYRQSKYPLGMQLFFPLGQVIHTNQLLFAKLIGIRQIARKTLLHKNE